MTGSFGARMRQRREEQGITLTTIVEQTKIKRSLLESLEEDDVRYWPTGFFGRAFIRAYATAVGLNPDDVVREFLEAHPEPVEVVATPAPSSSPPDALRSIVGSALGSLGRLRRAPTADDRIAAPDRVVTPRVPVTVGGDDLPELEAEAIARVVPSPAVGEPAPVTVDLDALARVSTELGRVQTTTDLQALLRDAGIILDATGLILWIWDNTAEALIPALAHGYSDEMLSQLPTVRRDTENLTAAAFRSGETCALDRTDRTKGALVVPLLTPAGCAGVLAIEFQHGGEQVPSVRAAAKIFAALLALLISGA